LVFSDRYMAVTAHPLATEAARGMLGRGGSAVDAAVAAQMVLTLVESQSSGIGGGGFLLHHDAGSGTLRAYDGRETAPAAAGENDLRWISANVRAVPRPSPRASGRSIGTPGLLRMLESAHRDGGRLPWRELFAPAIRLAAEGFPVSARMAASIAREAAELRRDPEAREHFLQPDGSPKPAGTLLRNAALADTLRRIADEGADAFYRGDIAAGIVEEVSDVRDGTTPGFMTADDLAAYRARRREPLCAPYRAWVVCGMPPPSSGGLAVAQTLRMLERFDLSRLAPVAPGVDGGRPPLLAVHLITEAQRLAYADRDRHVADPDFEPLPGGGPGRLLDGDYVRARASRIELERSMGRAEPGEFDTAPRGIDAAAERGGTTHLSIVDAQGGVVSMTSSVESAFGSYRMTRGGFLLNNQLTDFSVQPRDAAGRPIANRMQGGKRPRSSMAPTIVFERRDDGSAGAFVMATGSPGGAAIIQYVTKALIGTLDWKLDPRQSAALLSFGAVNGPATFIGTEHPAFDARDGGARDPLVAGLRALGHQVVTRAHTSGIATILRLPSAGGPRYAGAADPRREGTAAGDAAQPP
jgi:gamma-glutamyltranspeptidase/glutathione hydrolase